MSLEYTENNCLFMVANHTFLLKEIFVIYIFFFKKNKNSFKLNIKVLFYEFNQWMLIEIVVRWISLQS